MSVYDKTEFLRTAYRPFAYCVPSISHLNTAYQKGGVTLNTAEFGPQCHYPFNNAKTIAWTEKYRPETGVLNFRLGGFGHRHINRSFKYVNDLD